MMLINISYNNKTYTFNPEEGIDISIPVNFNNNQNPKFYDESSPQKEYYKYNNTEYSIDKDAGCNVPLIHMNIHCCGTHTETANHIFKDGPYISDIKNINYIPSKLISINPQLCSNEEYHVNFNEDDKVITKELIKNEIGNLDKFIIQALIIRTLPNFKEKISKNYNNALYPFLSNDAVKYLIKIGVKHIIIDTPSIDRYNDDGKLGNHKIFFSDNKNNPNHNTITELVFIPDDCKDGNYFLNLGFPKFCLDAAPSRPTIYPIQ